jgi:hypothetical protein
VGELFEQPFRVTGGVLETGDLERLEVVHRDAL